MQSTQVTRREVRFDPCVVARRRVALYFRSLSGPGGGAERMIIQLAHGLSDSGFSVTLITWDRLEATSFYPINSNISWRRLGLAPGLLDKIRRTKDLALALRTNRIDTLVGFVMSGDMTVFLGARLAGVRIVAAERNAPSMYTLLYTPLRRVINFLQLHMADSVVVQIPRYVTGYPRSLHSRIAVVANPVPEAASTARPDIPGPDGFFTLLCVSRLDTTQKQLGVLIETFAAVSSRHPNWRLAIVGDGPQRAALEADIAARGLNDRITLFSSSNRVFEIYAAAHLFVMPSAWEGFPNSLAEAMAHGLPAVGFEQADGVADLILEAGGWLASGRGNPQTLASALELAMGDHDARRRRGDAARAAMARYTPEAQLRQWLSVVDPNCKAPIHG